MSPLFSKDIEKDLSLFLQKHNFSNVAIIVDENTEKHCLPLIPTVAAQAIIIKTESGEKNKTLNTCISIWDQLTTSAFDRKSLVINLGGGVIGDMGGFCASTYKRGIKFINIPTTLLSQVDASVGGKLGIDFKGLKNHIGLFKNPEAIFVNPSFLETLPKRELKSGYAEIIKHAIISSKDQWKQIKDKRIEAIDIEKIVQQSVKVKEAIVKEDPLEGGKRKILNFGHTVGHAIESSLLDSQHHLLHGEAVAIGIICESFISLQKNLISETEHEEIVELINLNYHKTSIKKKDEISILELILQDKKNENEKILMALPKSIGNADWDIEVSTNEIKASLDYYNNQV